MTIETSPSPPAAKATANKAALSLRSSGAGKDVPHEPLGFSSILAAEDAPEAVGQGIQNDDSLSKVPLAPVDTAPPAINIVAPLTLLSSLPVAVSATLQAADVAPPTPLATHTSVSPAAVKEQRPSVSLVASASVAAAPEVVSAASGKPIGNQAGKVSFTPATGVADSGKQHDTQFFAAMEAMKSMQTAKEPPTPALVLAVTASGLSGSNKPEKSAASADTPPIIYSANAPSLGTTSYASNPVAEIPNLHSDMQVAEQVTYWISQDIQNAALTLDGLGKDPVEVSIRMSGNEAQVSFRTDELQTRDLLESAAEHLKDLLQSEGLVLSGVSVGTSGSGSGEAGPRQQRTPSGSRQGVALLATDSVNTTHSADRPRRLGTGVQGRSLDLFV